MTKADIVNEITKNTGIDKTTVLTTVEAFMDAVKASLSKDENVYLRGFGRNDRNGCRIRSSISISPYFG